MDHSIICHISPQTGRFLSKEACTQTLLLDFAKEEVLHRANIPGRFSNDASEEICIRWFTLQECLP